MLGSAFLAVLAAGPSVIEQTIHLTAFRRFASTPVLILIAIDTNFMVAWHTGTYARMVKHLDKPKNFLCVCACTLTM